MNITIIGNIFGTSGYASHTRSLANAIYKKEPTTRLDVARFEGWEQMVTPEERNMITQPLRTDDTIIAVSLPNQWQPLLSGQYNRFFGYCVWEGSNVPKFWIDIFRNERVEKILVPSEHTKQSIVNTIKDILKSGTLHEITTKEVENKIVVVSHGVDLNIFKPLEKKVQDGKLRFIVNKGWASGLDDRGGVQFALQAFSHEFHKDEPVELLVKINTAYCGQGWNLTNEISKLELRPDGGMININMDNIPFDKLPEYYAFGDVFLAPNMSESFGLPMAEAMACGLPVITTNYGGQTDFVNDANGWLIDYELIDVDWDMSYENVQWAKPDIKQLRSVMRNIFNNRKVIEKKSKQAQKDISKFTWDASADKILRL